MDNHSPASSNITTQDSVEAFCGELFCIDPDIEWQMDTSEQMTLLAFVQRLKPECVIEVGSRFGGSMQVFSRNSKRVISCDIDTTCKERLGTKYPNAEFITGPSQETLPILLAKLEQENVRVGMMLIDGEHSASGVQGDIHTLLDYRPACHDICPDARLFQSYARRGIRTARWSDGPYVHAVEVDFVPGIMHYKPDSIGRCGADLPWPFDARTSNQPLKISAKYDSLFEPISPIFSLAIGSAGTRSTCCKLQQYVN